MSYLEALSSGRCTRCFRCCYLAVKLTQGLNPDRFDELGFPWIHMPVEDGVFDYLAVCRVAGVDGGLPSCIIQKEKPGICADWRCWEKKA